MLKTETSTALDIVQIARHRHTAKAYDGTKAISPETLEKLQALVQLSPSSTNIQPWHFVFATTAEGKDKVVQSTVEKYPFNSNSIRTAPLVVVFAGRLAADEDYMAHLLEREDRDGRYEAETADLKAERKAQMHGGRTFFANIHKQDLKDLQHWMDKQVYLNIGQFMLGAAALGLDTTPMEGIDTKVLDETFGLREKGFSSLVVVCVGYHHPDEDYNAQLPKSRLPQAELIMQA